MSAGSKSAPDYAGHSGAHTPGPWTFFANNLGVGVSAYSADVAHCNGFHSERSLEEESANARLIAAAPDMIDALKQAYDDLVLCRTDNAMQIITAAIAKAEGRP